MKLHPNDLQRIVRALAVFNQTGIPMSALKQNKNPPDDMRFEIVKLGLERDRLYKRINARVLKMVDAGLWEEFNGLCSSGYHQKSPGLLCVGYRELFGVLNGEYPLSAAIEKIQQNSRRYAKRQVTWFAHQTGGVEYDQSHGYEKLRDLFVRLLKR